MANANNRIRPGDRKGYQRCKRVFDIVFSLAGLLLLWPLILLIALLVRLQDGGKAFFSQQRLGQHGRPIRMWKIRSMHPNADAMLDQLTEAQKAQYHAEFKIDNDPRVTRLGTFLRRTSLDELPQLWNVLRGDMSLVGPRPIVPEEIVGYSAQELELFHSVPAGLTGYWQTCAGPDDSYTTGGRQKMELHYAAHANFGIDMMLVLGTFSAVIRKARSGNG